MLHEEGLFFWFLHEEGLFFWFYCEHRTVEMSVCSIKSVTSERNVQGNDRSDRNCRIWEKTYNDLCTSRLSEEDLGQMYMNPSTRCKVRCNCNSRMLYRKNHHSTRPIFPKWQSEMSALKSKKYRHCSLTYVFTTRTSTTHV